MPGPRPTLPRAILIKDGKPITDHIYSITAEVCAVLLKELKPDHRWTTFQTTVDNPSFVEEPKLTSFTDKAIELIQWYKEGSDLDDDQLHVLTDCAAEHGQILDNVIDTKWFRNALAENMEALA